MESCAAACNRESWCKFFWFGTMSAKPTCLGYEACYDLYSEADARGALYAPLPDEKKLCAVANPEMCWRQKQRRQWLTEGIASEESCYMESMSRKCDYYYLLGFGVEKCNNCEYRVVEEDNKIWQEKRVMPHSFETGEIMVVSCQDRYRGLTSDGEKPDGLVLKCVDGTWINEDGEEELGSFFCRSCVQATGVGYKELIKQHAPELYFLDSFEVDLFVDNPNKAKKKVCLAPDYKNLPKNPAEAQMQKMGLSTPGKTKKTTVKWQYCSTDKYFKGPAFDLEKLKPSYPCKCMESCAAKKEGDDPTCEWGESSGQYAGCKTKSHTIKCVPGDEGEDVKCSGRVRYEAANGDTSPWIEAKYGKELFLNCNSVHFDGWGAEYEAAGMKMWCTCSSGSRQPLFKLERASPSSSPNLRRLRIEGGKGVGDMCLTQRDMLEGYPGFAPCSTGPAAAAQQFTASGARKVVRDIFYLLSSSTEVEAKDAGALKKRQTIDVRSKKYLSDMLLGDGYDVGSCAKADVPSSHATLHRVSFAVENGLLKIPFVCAPSYTVGSAVEKELKQIMVCDDFDEKKDHSWGTHLSTSYKTELIKRKNEFMKKSPSLLLLPKARLQ
eukprot:TRINITY_DN16942_c0_g1_i1.p2 TRINITY_DN16942_c0_g1~~TRINITY_DN16942_c0_g1_i1.p2  ORF type:complete len:608 (+),score=152.22 TRINITY_DN16942_c0_g1_i1:3-1826(+)